MKKYILILLIILTTTNLIQGQSWQWGKRGGSNDNMNAAGADKEEVIDLVTDSQNNIYIISRVGKNNLNISGVPKTNFGDSTLQDVCLASFGCDGSYRWSKIIGGAGWDEVPSIAIDNQDNIYICGRFGVCGDSSYPPRIDNDIILPQNPQDCSLLFIAKYNSNGELQWFKRPMASNVTLQQGVSQTYNFGMTLDNLGNINCLLFLPQGLYANGAYTNSLAGSTLHVLKYDSNGNFINGVPIDMQLTNGAGGGLKMFRNPYNGYFYFINFKGSDTNIMVVGGQSITHTAYIACFNESFQFQWVREDTQTSAGYIKLYSLDFDSNNNIYIVGTMIGDNLISFLDFSIPEFNNPNFLLKVNPTATSKIWGTTYTSLDNADPIGMIKVNGNEVAFATRCWGENFTWGTQSIFVNNDNQGSQPLLARFNKETGDCLSLSKITNNLISFDTGSALTIDSSGNYIMGGSFGNQLLFTTNTLYSSDSESDFFIAKFSTNVCTLNTDDFKYQGLNVYPNPVENMLRITSKEALNYQVFDEAGKLILEGKLSNNQNDIDFSKLSSGVYFLKTTNGNTEVKTIKLIKK
ncbi:T9SS type A sorting domain-containing protein [Flavobacterium sp. SUN046]|uniref:T9SS type A sorting domain-containing protein n=1 Tax=Flavobacterium sp. SUN046 TaxID=3002440 RepID=UPI002DBA5487|nr:T9SS type A sorting domain-containing protein [Flavobacterium sp. SUN046]MEC4049140.1 T9SS type A sorting domain-containing protein [Flavobacterium sp. SUN046]